MIKLFLILIVIFLLPTIALADDFGGSEPCESDPGPQCTVDIQPIIEDCGDRYSVRGGQPLRPLDKFGNKQPVCREGLRLCPTTCGGALCYLEEFVAQPSPSTTPTNTCIPVIQKLCPDQITCVANVPWDNCPGNTQTPPDSGRVDAYPNCSDATRNGRVILIWSLGLPLQYSECANITGYKVERWEVDQSGNIINSTYREFTIGTNTSTYTDNDVATGKRYKYKVTAIINILSTSCNVIPTQAESNIVTIQTCASIPPQTPSSPQPPSSQTPTTSNNPSSGKYVCKQFVQPQTSGGQQLQLQTLQCGYVP